MKRQRSVLKQMNKEQETYRKTSIDPRTFVILDDCLYDASWTKDKMMRLLFMNGRHWKVMLVITMQYPLGILLTCVQILTMSSSYVNLISIIENESMKTMPVCFLLLNRFVKSWISAQKTLSV